MWGGDSVTASTIGATIGVEAEKQGEGSMNREGGTEVRKQGTEEEKRRREALWVDCLGVTCEEERKREGVLGVV